jgi:lipoprotein-releasing system permease protein
VSLSQAQQLFDYPASVSALKVRLAAGADCQKVCDQISKFAPQGVVVRTREQLSSAMYKVLDYEKLAIVLIGVMILIVASFSVVGTLTMLIIDKKESIATLRALGADTQLVRRIFVRQGMAICMMGAAGGFVLGLVVSLVQQHFGVIRIPADTFLVEAYPVRVVPSDLMIVVAAFTAVSYLATRLTIAGRIKNID